MYLVLFVGAISMLSSILMVSFYGVQSENKLKMNILGDLNVTTNTYSKDGTSAPFRGGTYATRDASTDKELVTKVLLRTCSHLYVKARMADCPNSRSPVTVWSFAGTVNGRGSLVPAWTGGTATTFSCADIDAFGRNLIQSSLPVSFIQSKNYRYDFTGMSGTGRSDPCGYSEIVDID